MGRDDAATARYWRTTGQQIRTLKERNEANPRQPPSDHAPSYVHACHHDEWFLQLRHKAGSKAGRRLPFRCKSRHHEGPCRDAWRAQLFARTMDKRGRFASCNVAHAMFWTLTFDGRARTMGRLELHRRSGATLARFVRNLNKKLDRMDLAPIEYFWIREEHPSSGFVHFHVVVVHEHLSKLLHARDKELASHTELNDNDAHLAPQLLMHYAKQAGFGERFDARRAKNRGRIAGYVTKVVANLDGAGVRGDLSGEVAKISNKTPQMQEMLPRHCRTYGYTKDFIAPRHEGDGEWTGWLETKDGTVLGRQPQLDGPEVVSEFARVAAAAAMAAAGIDTGRVFDSNNVMASWATKAEAVAYAQGEAARSSTASTRTFRLRRDLAMRCVGPPAPGD